MIASLKGPRVHQGFTLLELIGVLATMAILAAVLLPNAVSFLFQEAQDREREHLQTIAQGVETYLRRNLAFPPTLVSLSPEYVAYDARKLTENARGFPRYFFVHPAMNSFTNAVGLTSGEVADARFLLISDLSVDVNPTMTNAAEFEAWWTTDDSTNPNLHIHRGNVGSVFHQLTVTAEGAGASHAINGAATNSGGGNLSTHSQYHLAGTPVGFDEADAYAVPEVAFALTTNTAYWFDPKCTVGQQWNPLDPDCEAGVLWLTTTGTASGAPGAGTWTDAEVVVFGDSNLTYEPGPTSNTSGTFSWRFDLENFTPSADVDAIHYVGQAMTIGGMVLLEGDLMLSTTGTETLVSTNTLTVKDEDVFLFRADTPRDYSAGTFSLLIDGSDLGLQDIEAFTLVEKETVVGGTVLPAGSMLWADEDNDAYYFVATSLGPTTSGTQTWLIDGSDIHFDSDIEGLDVVETSHRLGNVTLQKGQMLVTLADAGNVGDNTVGAKEQDIFILDLTSTGSSTAGTVTLLLKGGDVNLGSDGENIDGISIGTFKVPARAAPALQVLYTFEEGNGSTVTDVSGVGSPLNLTVQTPANSSWVTGALSINASTIVESSGAATKIIDAVQATDEITIEAWVLPANTTQGGPSRIVTLSQDPYSRNFTLAQDGNFYDQRLRTTATSNNGIPSLSTGGGTVTTALTHVVYTRDAAGVRTIYLNGIQKASDASVVGNFSNWDAGYKFGLANEFTLNRTWLGELHLVAVYDSALKMGTVRQNFAAGAN